MLDRHRSVIGGWDWPQPPVVATSTPERDPISYPEGLEWVASLRPTAEPELRKVKRGSLVEVFHVDLGTFRSAPEASQGSQDLCYGKYAKCLDDCSGMTTCQEVLVARQLTKDGWDAGWWNPYSAPAPAHWQIWQVDRGRFRKILRDKYPDLLPVFSWPSGVPDVVAWRMIGETFRVVAVECKCVKPNPDPIAFQQESWMANALAAGLPRSSLVVAQWKADANVRCD
jgi:hypothetical protein